MYKLPKRLQVIANLIPSGCRVLDVGTDHGQLLFYLAKSAQQRSLIGLDRSEMALCSARHNCLEWGLGDVIDFRLSNGLEQVELQDGDVIVLAGMGGQNMINILSKVEKWPECCQIIVQPNRDWAELRQAFLMMHLQSQKEMWLESRGIFYTTMLWKRESSLLSSQNDDCESNQLLGILSQIDDLDTHYRWLALERERLLKIPLAFRDQRLLRLIETRIEHSCNSMLLDGARKDFQPPDTEQ